MQNRSPSHLSRRRLIATLPPLLVLTAMASSGRVWAQGAFPQRPVKFIVPNAPGSSVDTIARILGTQMAQGFPQPIVVDNKAGAAGALGVEVGRASPADGYTQIIASSSAITIAPLLQKAVPYDPLKDFEFVSLIAMLPNVLVVNPALPVRNVAELIAYAKSKGSSSNMASAGVGSTSHLAGAALQAAGGFQSLHVPYKGGAQGVTSVVSGETDWVLTPAPAAMGQVQTGRLRLLGHSMSPESRPLGDVPSIAQTLPGFEFAGWIGLMAPKGLPPAAVESLRRGMAQALQQPELRKQFDSNGAVPTTSTPQEFRAFLVRDIEAHKKAIEVAGVKAE